MTQNVSTLAAIVANQLGRHKDCTEQLFKDIRPIVAQACEIFSIGRWVPVSERLPEFGADGYWNGYIIQDGGVECGLCSEVGFKSPDEGITHWLDLSLPSGKGEA